MPLPHRACTRAALVALALAVIAAPGVGWADDDDDKKKKKKKDQPPEAAAVVERPDLAIEFAGFSPPGNDRTITFRVTNIGKGRSSPATAFIRAASPPPENRSQQEVPELAPGLSHTLFYGLSGNGCDGHIVRAMVNDPMDLNGTNDSLELKVCPEKPAAPQGQGPSGPDAQTLEEARQQGPDAAMPRAVDPILIVLPPLIPEHLQPGNHSMTQEVNGWRVIKRLHRTGNFYLCDDTGPPTRMMAGFSRTNFSDFNNCQNNRVYQTALRFDLSELRPVYGKLVLGRAILTWDDTRVVEGRPPEILAQADGSQYSCVAELGKPTVDWSNANDLIPNDYYLDTSGNRVNVTNLVLDWLRDPAAERLGVLLKGQDESLDAEDSTEDCYSYIDHPRLVIDYTVLP